MSDDSGYSDDQLREGEYRKALSSITTKVLDSFLRAKGVPDECPMCGQSEMVVPQVQFVNQDNGKDIMGRHAHYGEYIKSEDESFNPINYSYHVICKHCGYIMQYNTGVVLSWYLREKNSNV
ncbi:hypothetical protein ACSOOV_004981 [Escherichia coli]|uniref:hypothetical protein n=1 Tax=Escherichia sp. 10290 TaxID=2935450 RepID=UPI0025736C17|nr:hypothetical protein [Escherichia sp. 10290]EKP2490310.1 hypothetical protein [Escherichia coli]EKP2725596.1 hypothetical protein [Escherichia coli]BDI37160.1 hypothetical protein EsCdI10290_02988 [Escherichia sp. 10290]HBX1028999.1 hypothetical protein [Salmonella enterica]